MEFPLECLNPAMVGGFAILMLCYYLLVQRSGAGKKRMPPKVAGACVGFWAPFLCGVKAQIVRAHLSYLFKWRGVRLGKK